MLSRLTVVMTVNHAIDVRSIRPDLQEHFRMKGEKPAFKHVLLHLHICFIGSHPVKIIPDIVRINHWLGRNHKCRHIDNSI